MFVRTWMATVSQSVRKHQLTIQVSDGDLRADACPGGWKKLLVLAVQLTHPTWNLAPGRHATQTARACSRAVTLVPRPLAMWRGHGGAPGAT